MAGLPRKYAKMGFAKGWRAYKKSKRKTRKRPSRRRHSSLTKGGATVARRKSTRKRRPAPRRRTTALRRYTRRATPALRRTMNNTTKAAIRTGVGLAGAVGSAAVVNMLPITDPRAKALTQLGVGLLAFSFFPKRNINMRIAAAGTSLAGALALVKASGVPVPLLAGNNARRMGINYYPTGKPTLGRSTFRAAERGTMQKSRVPMMGVNKHYGGMAGGYGSRFVTQASM